ncbi:MAG: transporter substrate-binding domain-containing protein, partial [Bacilli bacterium]
MKIKTGIIILSALVLGACSSNNIKSSDTFTVGMEFNYAPHNWTQAKETTTSVAIGNNQYCDGYDVDIAKKIAKDMNKKLVIKKIAWEGLIPSVNSGEIDAIIAGMSPTPKRKEVIDFSEGYSLTSFVVVVNKKGQYTNAQAITDFTNAKITAQMATFHVDFLKQMIGINEQEPMKDFPTMAVALNAQQIDGFISDFETATTIVKTNPDLVIVSFDEAKGFKYDENEVITSIGIKKGNKELLDEINKSLALLSEKDFSDLMLE